MTAPPPLPRFASEVPPHVDCVIVGGGIIGAATAFHAARAGLSALVVERRPALASLTTAASAGGFRAQFEDPDEIALMRESLDVFASFGAHTGVAGADIGLVRGGYLWVTTRADGAERHRRLVEHQRAHGLDDVEHLSGSEARRRFPFLAPEVTSARLRLGDGWLDPRKLALGFAAASRATFCVSTEVVGLRVEGGRVTAVRTSRGEVSCGAVVLAAGPFTARLAAAACVPLPIELMTRHKVVLAEEPAVPRDAPMTIDEDSGAHWRPHGDGALVLCPHADTPDAAPLEDVPSPSAFAFTLLAPDGPLAVARTSPFWRAVWARGGSSFVMQSGQYALTPDRKPLIGPTSIGGLHVNGGYSGHGIMASAAGARLLVQGIVGRAEHPFRLDRSFAAAAHGPL
ncbi:MAG: FAD-dependent oxidoreductase [Polyangiaceae bacterium]